MRSRGRTGEAPPPRFSVVQSNMIIWGHLLHWARRVVSGDMITDAAIRYQRSFAIFATEDDGAPLNVSNQ